ncbi:hypothetical protein BC835DRAFT_434431 [Cytidiella melzeri]|nr:hypothetical protein BC835DRAFT_434431 [Cytidiella melzeri]
MHLTAKAVSHATCRAPSTSLNIPADPWMINAGQGTIFYGGRGTASVGGGNQTDAPNDNKSSGEGKYKYCSVREIVCSDSDVESARAGEDARDSINGEQADKASVGKGTRTTSPIMAWTAMQTVRFRITKLRWCLWPNYSDGDVVATQAPSLGKHNG